ncbi:hypothetical protein [Amycolatopsis anabasis]|uniref:hypothetical protein n=1 Tax=Amycolatopsis anabasis TaxID=1840409 RepID=UPI00131D3183|nr:hypothetical protein [Amycolatopsis anabasis]
MSNDFGEIGELLNRQYVLMPVRWRRGEPRLGMRFPPVGPTHVVAAGACPLCPERLGNGQAVVQLAAGPVDDESARLDAQGETYTAAAYLAHELCAQRFSESEIELTLKGLPPLVRQ